MVEIQNETDFLSEIIDRAYERGLRIALNPSPMNERIKQAPLEKVTWLILNEIEGGDLTGETAVDAILEKLSRNHPSVKIMLALGRDGAIYFDGEHCWRHGIYDVPVVDTTGAGDTFLEYFLAAIQQEPPAETLRLLHLPLFWRFGQWVL